MGDMADWVNDDTPGPEPEQTGRNAFLAQIAELRERVATVHERVACPACGAHVGARCVQVHRPRADRPLKHSHRERLRADGIPER